MKHSADIISQCSPFLFKVTHCPLEEINLGYEYSYEDRDLEIQDFLCFLTMVKYLIVK